MNNEKELSLVVFGASGFTGRLVAEYLAAQYGDNLKWAMAGRNEEKLKFVREEVGAGDVPLIIADSDDEASLKIWLPGRMLFLQPLVLISFMEKVCSKPAPKRERIMWIYAVSQAGCMT